MVRDRDLPKLTLRQIVWERAPAWDSVAGVLKLANLKEHIANSYCRFL